MRSGAARHHHPGGWYGRSLPLVVACLLAFPPESSSFLKPFMPPAPTSSSSSSSSIKTTPSFTRQITRWVYDPCFDLMDGCVESKPKESPAPAIIPKKETPSEATEPKAAAAAAAPPNMPVEWAEKVTDGAQPSLEDLKALDKDLLPESKPLAKETDRKPEVDLDLMALVVEALKPAEMEAVVEGDKKKPAKKTLMEPTESFTPEEIKDLELVAAMTSEIRAVMPPTMVEVEEVHVEVEDVKEVAEPVMAAPELVVEKDEEKQEVPEMVMVKPLQVEEVEEEEEEFEEAKEEEPTMDNNSESIQAVIEEELEAALEEQGEEEAASNVVTIDRIVDGSTFDDVGEKAPVTIEPEEPVMALKVEVEEEEAIIPVVTEMKREPVLLEIKDEEPEPIIPPQEEKEEEVVAVKKPDLIIVEEEDSLEEEELGEGPVIDVSATMIPGSGDRMSEEDTAEMIARVGAKVDELVALAKDVARSYRWATRRDKSSETLERIMEEVKSQLHEVESMQPLVFGELEEEEAAPQVVEVEVSMPVKDEEQHDEEVGKEERHEIVVLHEEEEEEERAVESSLDEGAPAEEVEAHVEEEVERAAEAPVHEEEAEEMPVEAAHEEEEEERAAESCASDEQPREEVHEEEHAQEEKEEGAVESSVSEEQPAAEEHAEEEHTAAEEKEDERAVESSTSEEQPADEAVEAEEHVDDHEEEQRAVESSGSDEQPAEEEHVVEEEHAAEAVEEERVVESVSEEQPVKEEEHVAEEKEEERVPESSASEEHGAMDKHAEEEHVDNHEEEVRVVESVSDEQPTEEVHEEKHAQDEEEEDEEEEERVPESSVSEEHGAVDEHADEAHVDDHEEEERAAESSGFEEQPMEEVDEEEHAAEEKEEERAVESSVSEEQAAEEKHEEEEEHVGEKEEVRAVESSASDEQAAEEKHEQEEEHVDEKEEERAVESSASDEQAADAADEEHEQEEEHASEEQPVEEAVDSHDDVEEHEEEAEEEAVVAGLPDRDEEQRDEEVGETHEEQHQDAAEEEEHEEEEHAIKAEPASAASDSHEEERVEEAADEEAEESKADEGEEKVEEVKEEEAVPLVAEVHEEEATSEEMAAKEEVVEEEEPASVERAEEASEEEMVEEEDLKEKAQEEVVVHSRTVESTMVVVEPEVIVQEVEAPVVVEKALEPVMAAAPMPLVLSPDECSIFPTVPAINAARSFRSRLQASTDAVAHQLQLIQTLNDLSCKQWAKLQGEWDTFREEQAKAVKTYGSETEVDDEDILELNVGGQPMDVKRSVLTQLGDTRLAAMFSGRWDRKLVHDKNGRIFVDENPAVFRLVVEQLIRVKHCEAPRGERLIAEPDHTIALQNFLDYWGLDETLEPRYKSNGDETKIDALKPEDTLSVDEDNTELTGVFTEKLGDLREAFVEAHEARKREWKVLGRAKRSWEDEQSFIFRNVPENKDADHIIYLNCVGYKLASLCSTIKSLEGSKLAQLFACGKWKEQGEGLDKDGNFYLEASPYSMGKILDLLRQRARYGMEKPVVDVLPAKRGEFDALVEQFFPDQEDDLLPGIVLKSNIVNNKQHIRMLSRWLPKRTLSLLYRGSRDGWDSDTFHTNCDEKGCTVVLIKSATGHIFGGYADKPWGTYGFAGADNYVQSDDAFLFSLTDGEGRAPVKCELTGSWYNSRALRNCRVAGPIFGGAALGGNHDLYIASEPQANPVSSSILGRSYKLPDGQDGDTFLAGSQNFQVEEMEVFSAE